MLKKIVVSMLFVFSMMSGSVSVSAAELKIGVINLQEILSKASQVKILNDKIQRDFKERYDELAALQKKGAELQEKAQHEEMTLTNPQKVEIKRQLQTLDSDFKLKQSFLQEDLNLVNKQEQSKILQLIQQAVSKVATDEQFDLILNSESAVHVSSAINISDKIVVIINQP